MVNMRYMKAEMNNELLKSIWDSVMENHGICKNISNMFFEKVIEKYNESGRFHHNCPHLIYMHSNISVLSTKVSNVNLDILSMAMFYHDVIYNPASTTNEQDSYDMAIGHLKIMRFDENFIKQVGELVLLTIDHEINPELTVPLEIQKIFLDSDMAILASDEKMYMEYSKNVRKEYYCIPKDKYNEGRILFLESALKKEKLFFTDSMNDEFLIKARENIKNEIDYLKNK